MSTAVMAACLPIQMPPSQKAVLISMADNADDSGECVLSVATICRRTCLSRATVLRCIEWLERAGRVTAKRSSGACSTYCISPTGDLFVDEPVSPCNRYQGDTGITTQPVSVQTGITVQPVSKTGLKQQQKQEQKAKARAKAQPPAKKPPAAREPIPEPPGWVDREAWDGFAEMRRRLRFPLTARAARLIFAQLEKLRAKGHDPTAVLDQSTRQGWRDVYPIKPESPHADSQPSRNRSVVERVEANIRARREREAASTAAPAAIGDG